MTTGERGTVTSWSRKLAPGAVPGHWSSTARRFRRRCCEVTRVARSPMHGPRDGQFVQANRTIFLAEIGTLPLALQPKL